MCDSPAGTMFAWSECEAEHELRASLVRFINGDVLVLCVKHVVPGPVLIQL